MDRKERCAPQITTRVLPQFQIVQVLVRKRMFFGQVKRSRESRKYLFFRGHLSETNHVLELIL